MQKRAKELEKGIEPEKLLSAKFMATNTEFASYSEMIQAAGGEDLTDEFVAANSKFKTLNEMVAEATRNYIL